MVEKPDLILFDLCPLQPHRLDVRKHVRTEERVVPVPQFCQEVVIVCGLYPIGKPTPFAADDVQQRVSHRMKTASQIPRELLNSKCGRRLQHSIVCPAVVLKE